MSALFRISSCAALLFLLALPARSQAPANNSPATAQPAAPQPDESKPAEPRFDVVDAHVSPEAHVVQFMQGGRLIGDRYSIRQASIPQWGAASYDFDSPAVVKGPTWLDMVRFDVTAKAPPGTPPATIKLMMRAVMKDRFNLVVHEGTVPMPAYILSAPKIDKDKMAESTGTGDARCQGHPPDPNAPADAVPQIYITCHNETMEDFAKFLQAVQGGGFLNKPVVNSVQGKTAYDFELKWTPMQLLAKAGADGVTLFDALDKQLGLKLSLETAPRPALIVDSVNETPTPNPPGTEKLLPPPAPPQFEVSTIRPSKPDTRATGQIQGGLIDVKSISLKDLITLAWSINPVDTEGLVGAPAWLDKDKFDITAKVASVETAAGQPKPPQIDFDDLKILLRGLIEERFKMQSHMEKRPVTAYNLVAAGPKIKPAADPSSRSSCIEGPGPDGKEPRTANPTLNRLMWCQNMTMPIFAHQLQFLANGFIYYPVVDQTGMKGGWDFLLNFSSINQLTPGGGGGGGGGAPPAASGSLTGPSDPNGAVSLFDAIKNQLGLKLEKVKRDEPVLVIDHIEEQPTEN